MTEWKEVFEQNRAVPAHSQTVRQSDSERRSQGFQIVFKHLDGASVFPEADSFQLRVSFFDTARRHFFGRTWRSSSHHNSAASDPQSRGIIPIDEVVYFHSSLCRACVVAVVELVAGLPQQASGCGFGVLQLFSGAGGTNALSGSQRILLYRGTPRALLIPSVQDGELNKQLAVVDGVQILCSFQAHPALSPIMHLFPQNMLVSGHTNIPGLVQMSDNSDWFRKPRVQKSVSCSLDRLVLFLSPSLERFEQDLLHMLTEDCHNTGPTLAVQERRLHVGVHNGWTFVEEPQVLVLQVESSGRPRGRSGSFRRTTGANLSSSSPVLVLKGAVPTQMVTHPAFALIVQLEYVFSSITASEGKLSSTSSRVAFLQCLGWAAWSPFSADSHEGQPAQVTLHLHSRDTPNPFGLMVYSRTTEATAGDVQLSFQFSTKGEKTQASPGGTRGGGQTRGGVSRSKHSGSPAGDESMQELQASLWRSAQGPGLSLSQLEEASRYPTLSHSTGSPWQQSVSSRLRASPLAPAHQLPHVDRFGVSSIVHLEMSVNALEDPAGPDCQSGEQDDHYLQELAYTPVQAPVIMLGTRTTVMPSQSSRSSLAHLFSAGFPDVRDLHGLVAEVVDPGESLTFNPQKEESDPLQSNTLILQFLAFSRISQIGVAADWPHFIHFTFQLYRFPPVSTQRVCLTGPQAVSTQRVSLTGPQVQGETTDGYPCILHVINKDGTVNTECPGLQLRFTVGAEPLHPGEKRSFLRYLAQHSLQIDIWDSQSLLLIGSAAVELKHLLRQGRSAVQIVHELEVVTTEFIQDGHVSGTAMMSPINILTTVRGRLHLRLGNVGGPVEKFSDDSLSSSMGGVVQASRGSQGFGGGSLFSHCNAHNTARALRMVEVHGELLSLLKSAVDGTDHRGAEESRLRKLSRMAAVRQSEQQSGATEHKPYMWHREERALLCRDLRVIEAFRERNKAEGIANMLSQSITTQHTLHASLGTTHFFEFHLKNPLSQPQTVTIHSQDPELSVVVSTEEWRHLKLLTKTSTPLEEDMVKLNHKTLVPQVYLRPKEALFIPLKYQTFVSTHTLCPQAPGPMAGDQTQHGSHKLQASAVSKKCIKMCFQGQDGKPMAICEVLVELIPHTVDQTFRFSHPEGTFLKKAIRLPPWTPSPEEAPALQVRCTDPNIICGTRTVAAGEPQDVYIKVAGCPSPQIKKFFITVFTDRWLVAPAQIWQVYVHFLQRLDISCVAGQLTCQSLVLRGTNAVRKVKCHVSHPLELQVDPCEVFVLPPRAVQDVQLRLRCCRTGVKFVQLSAVDVEQLQLLESWLICLTTHPPVISKAFEICLPVGGGRGSTKKISFSNPYPNTRTFHLLSDHSHLLQFKEDTFQVDGGQTYSIGLRFAPSQSPGQEEILIYVNNQEELNEETFCVKVIYR